MAKTVCLVVPKQVLENERVSFKFMGDARIPEDFYPYSEIFGVITLKPKKLNEINPFNIGRRPEERVEEFPTRWNINVFEAGKGLDCACGFDHDPNDNGSLVDLLINTIPDCVLLANPEALAPIRVACEKNGIELLVHSFDGILTTS